MSTTTSQVLKNELMQLVLNTLDTVREDSLVNLVKFHVSRLRMLVVNQVLFDVSESLEEQEELFRRFEKVDGVVARVRRS